MAQGNRAYYLYTDRLPDEEGFLAVEETYRSRLKAGDGLWLVGEKKRLYSVDGMTDEGVYLSEQASDEEEFAGPSQPRLPAMRQSAALMPMAESPFAVEVEHGEGGGPGEMVIELYGKDQGGLFKTTSDEEDAYLAESLKGLLRMQIKTMESTAEIGDMWIRRLKEKQRRK